MLPRLEIDALRALQAIVTHGGVTRASDHLSLSQSAVSHKMLRLEENIGSGLLNRKAGAPLLTEAGERLLSYANRILSLHDEAVLSLSKRSLTGNIRLGMTEDITGSDLARILGRFARLFPDVSVRTHVAQSLTLQCELESGHIDIAVMQVFTADVRPDDMVLFKDRLCWAKSMDLQLDLDRPVPFLSYDNNCFYRKWMQDHVASRECRLKVVLECTSNTGIIAGIEAGLGVSIISARHVTPELEVIDGVFAPPPDIAYIVRKSPKSITTSVKALVGEIEREAGDFMHLNAVE